MSDIFFSYSREDLKRILPIVHALEMKGYSVFWDRDIPVGTSWRKVIGGELKAARCVMVAWSKNSINSRFVTEEADFGSQRTALVPLMLDPVEQPFGFGAIQAADFTQWDGSVESEAFQKLHQDITAHLRPPHPSLVEKSDAISDQPSEEASDSAEDLTDKSSDDNIENATKKRTPGKRKLLYLLLIVVSLSITGVLAVYLLDRQPSNPVQVNNPIKPTEIRENGTKPLAIDSTTVYPELVKIKPGCFKMGSINGEEHEKPVHPVCIKSAFYIGKFEVTFKQFDMFAKAMDQKLPNDYGWGRDKQPVIGISWHDALKYARWVSTVTGTRCRLPSEAEWEYSARANTTNDYALPAPKGSSNIKNKGLANCVGCGSKWDDKLAAPVGSFKPNAWGLHDMHGNVWEWTVDCWHDNYEGAPGDGSAWQKEKGGDCKTRILRGGSWYYRTEDVRSADRNRFDPDKRDDDVGFRLVCSGPLGS